MTINALANNTAKLPPVEILKMDKVIGKSTIESMQSGVFFGALGSSIEIINRIKQEAFLGQEVIVIATGGFAHLFENQSVFDKHIPDLVLQGIRLASDMNTGMGG